MTDISTNSIEYSINGELLRIEAWGNHGIRVRSTRNPVFSQSQTPLTTGLYDADISQTERSAQEHPDEIVNGKISAKVDRRGSITFYREGVPILQEYLRDNREDFVSGLDLEKIKEFNSALRIRPRSFQHVSGEMYATEQRFEADEDEKLFGMGQYQQNRLNLKGCRLELAQRNSQTTIPFVLSNKGYGFLWNNAGIGEVIFGNNETIWRSSESADIDYWITAGDSPAEIMQNYTNVVGRAPMMPDFAMGYWQSKLRYRTQSEVIEEVDRFIEEKIPVSVIVIDYYHWPLCGDFSFDPTFWPDPEEMVKYIESKGIKVVVSVWPTIDTRSDAYNEMKHKGYLVRVLHGLEFPKSFFGNNGIADFTNPEVRKYIWEKIKSGYVSKGITDFWLDLAEPEYTNFDPQNYHYFKGDALSCGNSYPSYYAQMVYDGLREAGVETPVTLIRSAWVGSQRYGALLWSGDIDSSFRSLKQQISAGLNTGIAGIPWWTTDIGGFSGGLNSDEEFRELVVRWTQFATFCPVMRMHGDREPHQAPLSASGAGVMPTGADTAPWAYGEEAFGILRSYIEMREKLRPYISNVMSEAHLHGTPAIRPLFFNFPQDSNTWDSTDTYMFGNDIVVKPISNYQQRECRIYLPSGVTWVNVWTGEQVEGGKEYCVEAPLEIIPLFVRSGSDVASELSDYSPNPNIEAA